MKKTFVVVLTYNEIENIRSLLNELMNLRVRGLSVVVVDDNSPDGTWKAVQEISRKNKNVHLLHRIENKGRSFAGKAGFEYALANGADYIIEMDADFSHQTKYIPDFLKEIENYDVVLGSRFVEGGRDLRPGKLRWLISYLSGFYIRLVFGTYVKDCNSGYRCFRRGVLENIGLDKIISGPTPSIVQEVLYLVVKNGYRIKEIPILFEDRKAGKSTLTMKALVHGLVNVLRFRWVHR